MHDPNFFLSAFIYLAAAVLLVPVAHRLGLGSVLGYLIGGVLIGPFVLGWVGGAQGEEALHFAEFGVVIMLFFLIQALLFAAIPSLAAAGLWGLFQVAVVIIFTMYGGGFATIPAFLADIFGPMNVGAIHGAVLTGVYGSIRLVNRAVGDPASQLRERHDASDFLTKTQDKLDAAT